MDSQLALQDLKEVKQALDSTGVRWFLSYGALLGIVRQKDFIPYDDDIDITIVDPLTLRQRKDISWKLQDLGFLNQDLMLFNIMGRWEKPNIGHLDGKDVCAYTGDKDTGIIVAQKRVNWSVFFFKEEDAENYICIPKIGSLPVLSTPKRFYEKGEWLKFKGEKFLVPSPVKEYLKYVYGENWKKPIKDYHAPQYVQQHDKEETVKKYFG
jgi:hypothetical protein